MSKLETTEDERRQWAAESTGIEWDRIPFMTLLERQNHLIADVNHTIGLLEFIAEETAKLLEDEDD